jgi:dienelactone hydrolase
VRIFEVLISLLLVAGALTAWLCIRTRALRLGFCALLGVALVCHLVWEGAHWQMAPAYLGSLLALLLVALSPPGRGWSITGALVVLAMAAASCALSIVLPVFSLPAPTGRFAVGTSIVSMTDPSRREDAIANDPHAREVVVQCWYPASPSGNPRAAYRRRSETSLASSYQSVTWTNSRTDAPVAQDGTGFPILLYNPGWNGRRTQNTALTEELASHGYLVVAIDHPYNSGPVALADGRVIKPVPAPELFDDVTPAKDVYAIIDKETAKETTDALFVLDNVRRMNDDPASRFYRKLDLSRIGAFGYSLGGAVAAEAAYRDPAIHAVLDLDTPLYAESGKHGIAQPVMLLCEDLTHTPPDVLAKMSFGQRRDAEMDEGDYARQLPMLRTPGSYQAELHGTLHTSFQDQILTSPLQRISGAGSIPPRRMIEILRAYTVAFFDQSLRGIPAPLLSARPSPFPEANALFASAPATSPQSHTP